MPDDEEIINMDPVQYSWMYQNWIEDHRDNAEFAKNQAYIVGSFINSEAVKKLIGDNKHVSTDEEFEETSNMISQINDQNNIPNKQVSKPRKRKLRN